MLMVGGRLIVLVGFLVETTPKYQWYSDLYIFLDFHLDVFNHFICHKMYSICYCLIWCMIY